jgi:hypothetical protein
MGDKGPQGTGLVNLVDCEWGRDARRDASVPPLTAPARPQA